jgi:hypothetical protein
MFNPSGLECLTCTNYSSSSEKRRENYEELYEENLRTSSNDTLYNFTDFNEINIDGPYNVNIVRGDEYRVVLSGYSQYLEKADVNLTDNNLAIRFDTNDDFDLNRYSRKVNVKIITPNLKDLRLGGSASGDVSGFEEEDLYVRLDGATELNLDVDVYALDLRLSGAASLDLTGTGNEMNADVSSASSLSSYNYLVKHVKLKASTAAQAKVYASETLEINAGLVSDVKYRGGAKVTKVKSSTFSNIRED